MRVDVVPVLGGVEREQCWAMYEAAFAEQRTAAVQRHLMVRSEFDDVMADERIGKYVALTDSGAVTGIGTATTALDAVPLIEPAFFAARWPDLYESAAIFYVVFVATHRDAAGAAAFTAMIGALGRRAAALGGVVVADMSRNRRERGLDSALLARLRSTSDPGTRMLRLDEQAYLAYELSPTAAGRAGRPTVSLVEEERTRVSSDPGTGRP